MTYDTGTPSDMADRLALAEAAVVNLAQQHAAELHALREVVAHLVTPHEAGRAYAPGAYVRGAHGGVWRAQRDTTTRPGSTRDWAQLLPDHEGAHA
jgi:hypothetical protein